MGLLDVFKVTGREPGRAALVARGIAFLAVIAVIVTVLSLIGRGEFRDRWRVTAVVDNAGGSLVAGTDVKYDGVIVGKVRELVRVARGTEIRLDLVPSVAEDVPGDVEVRVLPASVFGISYVDLVSRKPTAPALRAGAVLPQDRSAETLEVQSVLDSLDRVVDSLGPAELATTLEGLASALDGNGERLGETIEKLHRYLGKLNPSMPLVRRNLRLLSTNLEAFQRYGPDLLDATDDILVAAQTLTTQEKDFKGLVEHGSRTLDATDRLVVANREALVAGLVRTAVLVDVLYDGRSRVVDGVLSLGDLAREFSKGLSYGRYLRIDGNLILAEEPDYTRADCPQFGSHRGRGC